MENLKLYRIEEQYINYLKSRDNRVQKNKNQKRPYVGVLLIVGSYKYFVPMESPKPNHNNIKPGIHIMRLDNGKLGLLGFNNMIPVPDSALISFDINDEKDEKYAELLRRQITHINNRKADVFNRASKTYYKSTKGNNDFLTNICCNFKKLEKACDKYNPDYKKTKIKVKKFNKKRSKA